jgi:hypothetical protein
MWSFKILVSRIEFAETLVNKIRDHFRVCFQGPSLDHILLIAAALKNERLTPAEEQEIKNLLGELENESRIYKYHDRYCGELYATTHA